MKAKLFYALLFGIGGLAYELVDSGIDGVDWKRILFMTAIMFVVYLLLPATMPRFGRRSSRPVETK